MLSNIKISQSSLLPHVTPVYKLIVPNDNPLTRESIIGSLIECEMCRGDDNTLRGGIYRHIVGKGKTSVISGVCQGNAVLGPTLILCSSQMLIDSWKWGLEHSGVSDMHIKTLHILRDAANIRPRRGFPDERVGEEPIFVIALYSLLQNPIFPGICQDIIFSRIILDEPPTSLTDSAYSKFNMILSLKSQITWVITTESKLSQSVAYYLENARKLQVRVRTQEIHRDILNIAIALSPLRLPPYVLLHIVDWLSLAGYHVCDIVKDKNHIMKIRMIEKVYRFYRNKER